MSRPSPARCRAGAGTRTLVLPASSPRHPAALRERRRFVHRGPPSPGGAVRCRTGPGGYSGRGSRKSGPVCPKTRSARPPPRPRHEREGRAGPHRGQTEHGHVAGEGEKAAGAGSRDRPMAAGPSLPSPLRRARGGGGGSRGRGRAVARSGAVPEALGKGSRPAAGLGRCPRAAGVPVSLLVGAGWVGEQRRVAFARLAVGVNDTREGKLGYLGAALGLCSVRGDERGSVAFIFPKLLRVGESLSAPKFTSWLKKTTKPRKINAHLLSPQLSLVLEKYSCGEGAMKSCKDRQVEPRHLPGAGPRSRLLLRTRLPLPASQICSVEGLLSR